MKIKCAISWMAISCITFSLASCSKPRLDIPNRLPTFPVDGTVLVDGEPAEAVMVTFNPVTPQEDVGHVPRGFTDADGRLTIGTYGVSDGAPAGEYVLTFSKSLRIMGEETPDALKGRYNTIKKSTFKVEVEEGPLDLGEIELTTK